MAARQKISSIILLPFSIALSMSFSFGFTEIDGQKVAEEANKIIGTKYVYGGNSNKKGLDCSALVKNIYGKYGYKLPRRATWQAKDTKLCPTYTDLNDLMIGDAIYFQNKKKIIHHTAIVTGFTSSGTPIITHAKGKKSGVLRETMGKRYMSEFVGAKRFYKCTSPLSGNYTDSEIANEMMFASQDYGMTPKKLYDIVWKLSKINPLLITIPKSKNKEMNMDALLAFRNNGIKTYYSKGSMKIEPKTIKEGKAIVEGLYAYGYVFYIGLMQVESKGLSLKEAKELIYPKENFKKAKYRFLKCKRKRASNLFDVCYFSKRVSH